MSQPTHREEVRALYQARKASQERAIALWVRLYLADLARRPLIVRHK